MNRAWIPAGALAGMSVAGLLALGFEWKARCSIPTDVMPQIADNSTLHRTTV